MKCHAADCMLENGDCGVEGGCKLHNEKQMIQVFADGHVEIMQCSKCRDLRADNDSLAKLVNEPRAVLSAKVEEVERLQAIDAGTQMILENQKAEIGWLADGCDAAADDGTAMEVFLGRCADSLRKAAQGEGGE